MHQSQTSGRDSWFPLRMGYTGATHGGRAVAGAPGRHFMADDDSPDRETRSPEGSLEPQAQPTGPADRPEDRRFASSPWEPAGPAASSPWAPAEPSSWAAPAPPPPPPPPAPQPSQPPPPVEVPAPAPASVWDNPLSAPDAWVDPLAAEDAGDSPPAWEAPAPTPPPAWQVG